MTGLERLRAEISRKATSERVLEYLINSRVRHHTRRGLNRDCFCNFCNKKREITATFSYDWLLHNGYVRIQDFLPIPRPYSLHDSYINAWEEAEDYQWARHEAVKHARKIRRREVKDSLVSIRERNLI